jgi:GDPmannose 4,6-dehydratase
MKKRALITGINGQDGAYLSELLLQKGYEVYGADRNKSETSYWRLKELGIEKNVNLVYLDLIEYSNIHNIIQEIEPTEIYNLGAQSFVAASFKLPILTANVDAIGPLRILEAIRTIDPSIKFYQASTSELFGKAQESPQNENTPFYPRSPYGVAKLYAHWITKNYRESFNIFTCSGILFNHESPFRGLEFVTKKITNQTARISLGLENILVLGNLDAARDWGFSKEYVEGMWLMMQHSKPDDYVLATGISHTIREFVQLAFKHININIIWEGSGVNERGINSINGQVLVKVSKEFYRQLEVDTVRGDAKKANEILGWRPKTDLETLVGIMLDYDLNKVKKTL